MRAVHLPALRTLILALILVLLASTVAWAAATPEDQPLEDPTDLPSTDEAVKALDVEALSPDDLRDPPEGLPTAPPISAKAYALVDMSDGTVLAESGIEQRRAIASLTKIMTALIIVERTKSDDQVEISAAAVENNEGSEVGLQAGETYNVDQLLDVLLVYSANDAAKALAEHVGGSQSEFIGMMNDRARRLEMNDTRYTSVSGLDVTPLTQSTIADQIALISVAMKDPRIARAVGLKSVEFTRPGEQPTRYQNRNPLVSSYPGVDGIKTGHTDEAGYCLVARYSADGTQLISIVLGAQSEAARARDVRALLDHGRALRPKLKLVSGDEPVATVPVRWTGKQVELFPSTDVEARVRVGAAIEERYEFPKSLEGPIGAGDEVGNLAVYADGRKVGEVKLFAATGVRTVSTQKKVRLVASQWRRAIKLGTQDIRRASSAATDLV